MYRVYLLDDEPWALKGLRKSFDWESLGFQVIGMSTNPLEALQRVQHLQPDLIVTDIRMPELTGLEMIKACCDLSLDCEFIIVSGFADFEYARTAMTYGVKNYILKPINVEKAMDILKNIYHIIDTKKANQKYLSKLYTLPQNDESNNFIQLLDFVNSHFCDKDLSLKLLSTKFNFNTTYICDLFKKNIKKTFSTYVKELRLTKACRLLNTTTHPVCDVAEAVGYEPYYFNNLFKKHYNITPLKYRKGECHHD